jgi:hypothetical protein
LSKRNFKTGGHRPALQKTVWHKHRSETKILKKEGRPLSKRIALPLTLIVLLGAAIAVGFVGGVPEERVLRDIDGVMHGSLEQPAPGKWSALFFVTQDCPIANQYSPEIQRICTKYGPLGTNCFLVYVDPGMTVEAVRKHRADFGLSCCSAIRDNQHQLVRAAGATVSSEVAVFSSNARLEYRGRINDFYAGLGTPKQHVAHHDLRNARDALVAGQRVPRPRTEAFGCFIPESTSEN